MATNAEIRAASLAALADTLTAAGRAQSGSILRRGRHLMCATDQALIVTYARVTSEVRGSCGVVGLIASMVGNAPPSMITAFTLGTRNESATDPNDAPIADVVPPVVAGRP